MRKIIFTLLLAIVGSTWIISMASERWCLPSYQTETEPWIVVSGVLAEDGYPCEPDELCPPCLTIVLQADDGQTYYLTAGSAQVELQLDTAHLYANVTIEGVPFTRGSYNYIKVSNIDYILPVTQATKWYGVLYEAYPYWPGFTEPRLSDSDYSLQGDTVISGKSYSKLCAGNGNYVGAIRYSASGRQAYYVPKYNEDYLSQIEELEIEKDAEYLLYDLNVKVGDTVRAFSSTIRLPCGRESLDKWVVLDVQTIDGRIHAHVKAMFFGTEVEWIEGIGTPYIVWSGERDCQPTDGSIVRPYTLCAADNAGNILYSYNLEHIGVINECPNWSRITPDNPPRLPSLCDTWNVMVVWDPMCDDCEEYHTYRHYLTTDTIIGERHYRKLLVEGEYEGALREGDNKNIYCVPAGTTHEYLLYDFNAKVGDKLENVWLGGSPVDSPDGYVVTVDSVSETTPRIYSLHAKIKFGDEETHTWSFRWVEGVGLSDGPVGAKHCLECVGSRGYIVLCAYKDGEQVYASEASEEFGCYSDSTIDDGPLRLPSLCDTWNILEIYGRGVLPADEQDYTTKIDRLATDTVINNQRYVQLLEETSYADKTNIRYQGALREDDDANIYFVPPASTHEYLLYAFNAQVGDKLSNLWIGGPEEDNGGVNATIVSVTDEYPRVFTLDVEIVEPYPDGENIVTYPYKWVEGVGLDGGPRGLLCESVFGCACSCTQFVLCAYKDGKQVYAEKASEDWGCDFNHHPQPMHRLDDLCDEWTMVVYPVSVLPESDDSPIYYTQRLTADTLINGKAYRKLCGGAFWKGVDKNNYLGAMRQEYYYIKSQDPHKPGYRYGIFYIPEGSTHAYLLYDFNCYVGDTLRNLWIGGMNPDNAPDGYTGLVTAISASNPRRFELDIIDSNESVCNHLSWIEGVGTDGDGPTGESSCIAYDPSPALFCACKDGQKVYATTTNCQCGSLRLNYLCDTWNILGVVTDGEGSHYRTFTQRLTTDTIINSKRYVKLEEGITYKGALREDDYGRVYIIPANSTHEYLSYASQVKVSDEFDNVWFGGNPSDFPNGSKVTVREIEQINGRKVFKLDVLYQLPVMEQARLWPYYSWIEGVGLPEGPSGDWCPFDCDGDYGQSILCAYKDGEQVYASETAEKFGCYYDSTEQPADTIPLYAKVGDGPGSSTVDPVDPNEIVATLNGDELIIREYIGAEISFKLSKVSASNQAPARSQLMQSDSFRESVTITLTESGTYELELTNPEWNYSIVGTFVYTPTGVEETPVTTAPAQKVLMNGRLLIKHGDKVYTLTGMQVE